METEELIKLVDGIYKNILDKFNPGARQMINAGKAYLKALHGAAAASRLYVDAISKLAKQAQQGTWGGSSDIGAALMKIVEVYKEIQDQQMNILKAFYVDLLVPLETNLEKDTKVVQSEQKRFLQQHKQRAETYSKAAAIMKKQRKKSRSSSKTGLAMDKELKNMQVLEEEKSKLDAFCEQSLKNAMTQERRRYGFVLERQCSLAKHHLSYHTQGVTAYQQNLEKWSEVAKSREYLPDSVENIFSNRLRQISVWHDEDVYSNPRSPNFEEDRISITSQLRKTKSMDASCLDIRSIGNAVSPINTLSRAKSEYNLHSSTNSLAQEHTPTRRPKSMAVPPPPQWDTQLARALYAYLSSGENQLSFLEGDLIALIGERNKGWQFGENLRTQCSGWFPLAYTEILDEANVMSPAHGARDQHSSGLNSLTANSSSHTNFDASSGSNSLDSQTPRMFGDTLTLHRSSNNAKQIRRAIGSNNIPPPALPAPVPTPTLPYKTGITQSQSTNFTKSAMDPSYHHAMKSSASTFNFTTPANGAYTNHPQPSPPSGPYSTHPQPSRSDRPPTASSLPPHLQTKGHQAAMPGKIGGPVGNVSLHSSNDSGFSNDPPPQPEIDYSDDESITGQTKLPNRISNKEIARDNNNNPLMKPIRHSRSHGNIVDNKYHMSSDPETLAREHKAYVKRTKSFWKFGKNNSDNEILEGMALWRHRDLVDINDEIFKTNKITNAAKKGKVIVRREKSNDSDRTINNNYTASEVEERKIDKKKRSGVSQKKISVVEKQQISLPVRKDSELQDENVDYHKKTKSNKYDKNSNKFDTKSSHYDREFYDDDGDDGLMPRTVNRKDILQQYNDSTCGETSSEESDPYDCIVVDDQKVNKKSNNFPNVAEIGKKLEKLSKSSKYPPGKDNNNIDNGNQIRNSVADKNNKNMKYNNATGGEKNAPKEDEEIIHYDKQRNTFKTFGHNNAKDDKKTANYEDEEKYYATKRNNEPNAVEKRRFYASESKERTRAPRPSYESMDSSIDPHMRDSKTKSNNTRRMDSSSGDKRERTTNKDKTNNNYYDSTNDELSDVVESRQFLPRTKLSKTNSNNSKYTDNDVGLMEYGATLQRRLKDPEFRSSFEDRHNGNMYGPWYDLWGMEATAQKS